MSALRLNAVIHASSASAFALLLILCSLTAPASAGAPANMATAPTPGSTARSAVTYLPPDMSSVSPAELKHFYKWRDKMDWLLAPIHTRADFKRYLKQHAKSGSPLDALSPDARKRVLSELHFGPHGAFIANYSDLQYLSTQQVYKILALFGEQSEALVFTGGRIRAASPQAAPQPGKPSRIEKRFADYGKAPNPSSGETRVERTNVAQQKYAHWFAQAQTPDFVHDVGSHDLRLLFRTASWVAFVTFDAKYAHDASRDFAEMERRHFAGPADYEQMYRTLVQTRQFSAARKFYQAHPDKGLTPFPAYRDEAKNAGKNTPTVLVVSATRHELIRRPINLNKPAQVLILSDPECHFCADFDQALRSHPKLRAALEQHTVWVTPPGSELEFDTLQQWNKTHPNQTISIMYGLRGWPMVKILAVPQFFFLRHGGIVKHHMGWGKGGFPALESGLKAIGLWE